MTLTEDAVGMISVRVRRAACSTASSSLSPRPPFPAP